MMRCDVECSLVVLEQYAIDYKSSDYVNFNVEIQMKTNVLMNLLLLLFVVVAGFTQTKLRLDDRRCMRDDVRMTEETE